MLCVDPDGCVYSERKRYGVDMCYLPVCVQRRKVFAARNALLNKPRLSPDECKELAQLNGEWERLKRCGDVQSNA